MERPSYLCHNTKAIALQYVYWKGFRSRGCRLHVDPPLLWHALVRTRRSKIFQTFNSCKLSKGLGSLSSLGWWWGRSCFGTRPTFLILPLIGSFRLVLGDSPTMENRRHSIVIALPDVPLFHRWWAQDWRHRWKMRIKMSKNDNLDVELSQSRCWSIRI